jgi:4-alpha-glucanotransferase
MVPSMIASLRPGAVLPGYQSAWGEWLTISPEVRDAIGAQFAVLDRQPAPVGLRPDPRHWHDWGVAIQLYACWSERSWGTGDLADLAQVARRVRGLGGRWLLTSPLCAPGVGASALDSPYSPSSRRFLDPLLVAPDQATAMPLDPKALANLHCKAKLLGRGPLIERRVVNAVRRSALELLFAGRWDIDAFERFRAERGTALTQWARFSVLAEHFGGDWHRWPPELRRPGTRSDHAAEAIDHAGGARVASGVRFHEWCQWQADLQLAAAGVEVAIIGDMPFGFAGDGYDAWCWQDLVAFGMGAGAPPDDLGPQGQSWGFPVLRPDALVATDSAPLAETATSLVRHLSGLRIDHSLGLWRTWCVPHGASARHGAYVVMAPDLGLDAIQSAVQRVDGRLVAEALGTVGPGVLESLLARGISLTDVAMFNSPDEIGRRPTQTLTSWTNHDLPTTAGAWTGLDARVRAKLGLSVAAERAISWRSNLGAWVAPTQKGRSTMLSPDEVVRSVSAALARLPVETVMIDLADLALVESPQNVPGVGWPGWPSFRQRLPVDIDTVFDGPVAAAVAASMRDANR